MKKGNSQRHTYFVSTLSIALVLFLLGVVGYIGFLVESSVTHVVDQIQISALLKDKVDRSDVDVLINDIKTKHSIKECKYISKEEAAEFYKKASGDDFSLFIEENPLPASVDVTFTSGEVSQENIDQITTLLSGSSLVDEVLHPRGVVDQVLGHVYKIKFILYSFLITLFLISIVLINNAIRLAVRSKRFLIKSMKLIGATNGFIRRPFIASAVKQGLLASFSACLLLSLTLFGLNRGVAQISITSEELVPIFVIYIIMIFVGITISMICTYIAVNKQLNQKNSQMHVY